MSAVADHDHRLVQAPGEVVGRDGQVVPLPAHAEPIPAIERGVDLALARVEHGAHRQRGVRQHRRHRVERRHGRDGDRERQRQPLDRAETDAQPGERTGPDGHRDPLEVAHRPARVAEQLVDRGHESLGMRDADVEHVLADDPLVEERGAAGQGGGLNGEHTHERESSMRPKRASSPIHHVR